MKNFLNLIIFIVLTVNQTFKTESNPIDSSFVNYNPISDWRKHITIITELRACFEICIECFNTVNI